MCGEKAMLVALMLDVAGSPPRVRGKELREIDDVLDRGITPACAGKS